MNRQGLQTLGCTRVRLWREECHQIARQLQEVANLPRLDRFERGFRVEPLTFDGFWGLGFDGLYLFIGELLKIPCEASWGGDSVM